MTPREGFILTSVINEVDFCGWCLARGFSDLHREYAEFAVLIQLKTKIGRDIGSILWCSVDVKNNVIHLIFFANSSCTDKGSIGIDSHWDREMTENFKHHEKSIFLKMLNAR